MVTVISRYQCGLYISVQELHSYIAYPHFRLVLLLHILGKIASKSLNTVYMNQFGGQNQAAILV